MALVRSFQMLIPLVVPKSCSIVVNPALTAAATSAGGAWSTLSTRTVVRNQFPRARETKRVRVHGWWKRMSTPEGRRTLMRRILKGRHTLSH